MIEDIRIKFLEVEKEHYNIINKYIMGIVNIDEVNSFGKLLSSFKKELYEIETDEEILLEVAKMKSKIQHFYTEIMEDEELLGVAYSNKF